MTWAFLAEEIGGVAAITGAYLAAYLVILAIVIAGKLGSCGLGAWLSDFGGKKSLVVGIGWSSWFS